MPGNTILFRATRSARILSRRAPSRRLEEWPRVLVADPSRGLASGRGLDSLSGRLLTDPVNLVGLEPPSIPFEDSWLESVYDRKRVAAFASLPLGRRRFH